MFKRLSHKIENVKFRLIYKLDKLDKWCWADLVMWAMGYIKFKELHHTRECLRRNEYPYCGKCEKFLPPGGRLEDVLNPIWSCEKVRWVEKEVDVVD